MTDGLAHHYHVFFWGIRGDFEFLFEFSMEFLYAVCLCLFPINSGVLSGAILFAQSKFIEKWIKKIQSLLMPLKLKMDSLTQMITMGKSIH